MADLARSPRFSDGRNTRKRASISSLQDAQRNDLGMQVQEEDERSMQAHSSQKPSNSANDPKAPITSHKQISSVPTQESMKSLAILQSNAQINLPVPPPLLSRQVDEGTVTGIDSGEQLVGTLTDEGSLDDTRKRIQVFNQTTNLQDSSKSMMRYDCKSSQMFNSASMQTSASAIQRRLPVAPADPSASKLLTLRQIAEQAMANGAEDPQRQGPFAERAHSHTSGTATYYVDDVSSSPNKGNSLTQTEQKIQLTFSNTNQLMYSNGYSLLGQFASKAPVCHLTEDRGVCNFEVTL